MRYVFSCSKCGTVFEISCSIKELPGMRKSCPSCHSHVVSRVYRKVPVIYKAKGFYNTDNKPNERSESNAE